MKGIFFNIYAPFKYAPIRIFDGFSDARIIIKHRPALVKSIVSPGKKNRKKYFAVVKNLNICYTILTVDAECVPFCKTDIHTVKLFRNIEFTLKMRCTFL